jgi:preprotein translocase subunit SecG
MNYLIAAQITLAILLSAIILMQQQGSGLGGAFGGEGNVYRSRRGIEKVLFYGTIVLAIAFFTVALFTVYFNK